MLDPASKKTHSPRFLFWGLTLLFGGFAANTTLLLLGVHGYLRELTRLTTIVGLVLAIVGMIQAGFRMNKKTYIKKKTLNFDKSG